MKNPWFEGQLVNLVSTRLCPAAEILSRSRMAGSGSDVPFFLFHLMFSFKTGCFFISYVSSKQVASPFWRLVDSVVKVCCCLPKWFIFQSQATTTCNESQRFPLWFRFRLRFWVDFDCGFDFDSLLHFDFNLDFWLLFFFRNWFWSHFWAPPHPTLETCYFEGWL